MCTTRSLLRAAAVIAATAAVAGSAASTASAEPPWHVRYGPTTLQPRDDVTAATSTGGDLWVRDAYVAHVCPGRTHSIFQEDIHGASASPQGDGVAIDLDFLSAEATYDLHVLCTIPVDLGSAQVDTTTERRLSIKRLDTADRPASPIFKDSTKRLHYSILGADKSQFALSDDECKDKQITREQACGLTVSFHPTSPGPKHAWLAIQDVGNPWRPGPQSAVAPPRLVPLTGAA